VTSSRRTSASPLAWVVGKEENLSDGWYKEDRHRVVKHSQLDEHRRETGKVAEQRARVRMSEVFLMAQNSSSRDS
jgi:hypothetical protein